jgi:hypothetical protein
MVIIETKVLPRQDGRGEWIIVALPRLGNPKGTTSPV